MPGRRSERAATALALIGVIAAAVVAARWAHPAAVVVVGVAVAALALVVARTDGWLPDGLGPIPSPAPTAAPRALGRWALLCVAAVATAVVAWRLREGHRVVPVGAIAGPWLLAIGATPLAAHLPFGRWRWRWPLARPPASDLAPWLLIGGAAGTIRLVALGRFPSIVIGDEAAFIVAARSARTGTMENPFGTGFFSNPNLFPAVQGWLTTVVGSDPAGHRVLSALIGTAGVVAAWRLGRRLVGPEAALVGALVLAALPLHVHSSRLALNFITDPTVLTVALLLLVRTVERRRPSDAAWCGVVLGAGLYGNYGGRAFPVVIAVLLAVLAATRQLPGRAALRTGAWVGAGFVATAMPLIMFFVRVPAEIGGHLAVVSSISLRTLRDDPGRTLTTYAGNLDDAVLYPIAGNGIDLFFRHPAPYLGWPIAVALLVGLGLWLGALVRTRSSPVAVWLAVPWLLLTAGAATTVPLHGHRLLVLTPLATLLAGVAIVTTAHRLLAVLASGRTASGRAAGALALGAAVVLGASHLAWTFSEDRQFTTYGDPRTTAAWDLGWRMRDVGVRRVLFAGAPFTFAGGLHALRALAPRSTFEDVTESLTDDPPPLAPGELLVLVAERTDEQAAAARAYPCAEIAEVHAADGALLYTTYAPVPLPGWSPGTTAAGTTLIPLGRTPCRGG